MVKVMFLYVSWQVGNFGRSNKTRTYAPDQKAENIGSSTWAARSVVRALLKGFSSKKDSPEHDRFADIVFPDTNISQVNGRGCSWKQWRWRQERGRKKNSLTSSIFETIDISVFLFVHAKDVKRDTRNNFKEKVRHKNLSYFFLKSLLLLFANFLLMNILR